MSNSVRKCQTMSEMCQTVAEKLSYYIYSAIKLTCQIMLEKRQTVAEDSLVLFCNVMK